MASARNVCPSWEEYYMGVAALAAKRSKNPGRKVGAVICTESRRGKIVGVGYNGQPLGTDTTTEANCLDAAANALFFRTVGDTRGYLMFITEFPTMNGANAIIQAQLKELCYLSRQGTRDAEFQNIKDILLHGGVRTRQLIPSFEHIDIDFRAMGGDIQPPTLTSQISDAADQ